MAGAAVTAADSANERSSGGTAPPLRSSPPDEETNLRGPALQLPLGGMLTRSSSTGR
jgi:hypothetical protein